MKLVSHLRRAAVLGAGRLGPLLAAHLANAGVEVWLYDLPRPGDDPLAHLRQRIADLENDRPAALASPGCGALIHPHCLGDELRCLRRCDLVIEAVTEDLDIKTGLYVRLAPLLADGAILATATNSLSVNQLAQALPEVMRWRFCGLHMLFPPRHMPLVELVPNELTDHRVLERLESFLVTDLGKQVIRVHDRPYFVASRLGLYAMLLAAHHGERLGLSADLVDTLTGPALGRPRSGSFGLMDLLGLDTVRGWLEGAWRRLPEDTWLTSLDWPGWLHALHQAGQPIYRREPGSVQVWDPTLNTYRPTEGFLAAGVRTALAIVDPGECWARLRADEHPQAQFLWAMQRDLYHYAATWLGEIAHSARDLDLALRWGLGWREGLLETWQRCGWQRVEDWLESDIAAGRTLVERPLPDWVGRVSGVHCPRGSFAPQARRVRASAQLPVYRRQLSPTLLVGETPTSLGKTAWQRAGVVLVAGSEDLGIIDFSAVQGPWGSRVVEALGKSLERGLALARALVLWGGEGFCPGADLTELLTLLDVGDWSGIRRLGERWQGLVDSCRDLSIPVVAAVQGDCLGLGSELILYADRVVSGLESRFALVSPALGMPPGAGGLTALSRRAHALVGVDAGVLLKPWLPRLLTGSMARSAREARDLHLLAEADPVIMNPAEVLYVALRQASALADSGYRPPVPMPRPMAGREGLVALRRYCGEEFLQRDFEGLARVLVGGDLAAGTPLAEPAQRQLELEHWLDWLRGQGARDRLVDYLEGHR